MDITVAEALRLKKEVAEKVKNLQSSLLGLHYSDNTISYGTTKEEGSVVSTDSTTTFPEALEDLLTALRVSQTLNDSISTFNSESGISTLVRERQNSKLLIQVLEKAMPQSKASSRVKFEIVGDVRQDIKMEFEPFLSVKDIRLQMKELRASVRASQTTIDQLNTTNIAVDITESDLDSLDL